MKFSHTSEPSVRPQRKSLQPHDDLFIKIATGAFITLTSPLWIPLWILLLPFGRRRKRQKLEEHLVQAAIRSARGQRGQHAFESGTRKNWPRILTYWVSRSCRSVMAMRC